MSMEDTLVDFANATGADIKLLNNRIGDLTSLPTTAKASLVAALIELYNQSGSTGAAIDDSAGNGVTNVTWSADKIFDFVSQSVLTLKDSLLGGASTAYDTFIELENLMNNDASLGAALATKVGEKISFAEVQTLTTGQRLQACQNLGIGDPDVDLLAIYNAAKA